MNIVLNLLFVGPLRQGGLALATTISGFVGLIAGLSHFAVGRPSDSARRLLSTVMDGTFSVVMGVAVWFAYQGIQSVMSSVVSWHGSLLEAIPVGIVIALGAAVYLFMTWVLRVPELASVLDIAKRAINSVRKRVTDES